MISSNVLLGFDVWADGHSQSVTGKDYGADIKVGAADSHAMFFLKLGFAGSAPGTRLHYGGGLEYMIDHNWGALVEWTGDSKSNNAVTYDNNNYVVGVNYHF